MKTLILILFITIYFTFIVSFQKFYTLKPRSASKQITKLSMISISRKWDPSFLLIENNQWHIKIRAEEEEQRQRELKAAQEKIIIILCVGIVNIA